jgi:hypothetical protein
LFFLIGATATTATKAPPKRPGSAVHRRKAANKQNEGSYAIDGSGGVIVDLEVGGIENTKA